MENLADVLRVIVFVLFGLALGETAWIVRTYFGLAMTGRRLLPMHVFLIGTATMMLEVEAVMENVERWHEPINWHGPYNVLVFALLYAALVLIRVHVTRKRRREADMLTRAG